MLEVSTIRYICFTDDGDISKISLEKDDNLNNLQVELHNILGFLDGTDRLIDYKVKYDFEEKKYKIIDNHHLHERSKYQVFVHELETTNISPDITIIKDNVQKKWKLKLSDELKNDDNAIVQAQKGFSVTKKYDPNILYKVLNFKKEDNFIINFNSNFEFDNIDVSLYTIKRFSKYNYEVIDD